MKKTYKKFLIEKLSDWDYAALSNSDNANHWNRFYWDIKNHIIELIQREIEWEKLNKDINKDPIEHHKK